MFRRDAYSRGGGAARKFYSVNSPWGEPQPGLLHVVDLGGGANSINLPATAAEDLPATQEDDACHDSDDDEGEDSEGMDSAAAGPCGEYSQKRRGPVPRGDGRSRRGGKRRKA